MRTVEKVVKVKVDKAAMKNGTELKRIIDNVKVDQEYKIKNVAFGYEDNAHVLKVTAIKEVKFSY